MVGFIKIGIIIALNFLMKFSFSQPLFDRTVHFLERSLDLSTLRHKAISNNIANAETTNYPSKDIPFQEILRRSIDRGQTIRLIKTDPHHLSDPIEKEVLTENFHGEVNIDQEMAKLAQNHLMFQAEVQALMKKLEALKVTIMEGGK